MSASADRGILMGSSHWRFKVPGAVIPSPSLSPVGSSLREREPTTVSFAIFRCRVFRVPSAAEPFSVSTSFDGDQLSAFLTADSEKPEAPILLPASFYDIKNKSSKLYSFELIVSGGPSGVRTPDTLIKSQVLCQLS
jgi:hypothetical protein